MSIRTVVTIGAVWFGAGFVPAVSAQDSIGSANEPIEVITIIGKRPATGLAASCVNHVSAEVAAAHRNGSQEVSEGLLPAEIAGVNNSLRSGHGCSNKSALGEEAHI
jgi:hypothetical protein